MRRQKVAGFSITVIITIIALLVIIGVIVWRWHETGSQNQTSAPAVSTLSQKPDPNKGYVVIREWGVRFKPSADLVDVEYGIVGNTAVFSTKQLAALDSSCGVGADTEYPFGKLSRSTTSAQEFTSEDNAGAFVKRIGNYYYQYATPQSACSQQNITAANNLQLQLTASFKHAVNTLEAAK